MFKKLLSLVSVAAVALFARAEVVQDAFVDFSTMESYNFWKGGTPEGATFGIEDGALTIVNPAAKGNWEFQYFVADGITATEGTVYNVEIELSASAAGRANLVFGSWGAGVDEPFIFPEGNSTYKADIASPVGGEGVHVCLQTGSFVGTLKIKTVKVTHSSETPNPELYALQAYLIGQKENAWDNSIDYTLPEPLVKDKSYVMSIDYYGIDGAGQLTILPGGNWGQQLSANTIQQGKWTTAKCTFTAADNYAALTFMFGTAGNFNGTAFWIDNFSITESGSDVNLVSNGTFASGKYDGWTKPSWHDFALKVREAPEHPEPEPLHPNTVWVGPKTMNWGDGVGLDAALFANVCAGDTIIVNYETAVADKTFQTIFGGWSGLNIATYEFWKYDFANNDGNGKVTFVLPESFESFDVTNDEGETTTYKVFDMIKASGIVFQGPATLNSIAYIPYVAPKPAPIEVANIAGLAELTEEQMEGEVKLTLTDAKVTYNLGDYGAIFIEDATAAMQLYVMTEDGDVAQLAELAQGKAVTGTVTGSAVEGNMFMALEADVDITASVDADVTYGVELTVAQAMEAANVNKLVTFTASDALSIVNEEGALMITEGDNSIIVNDLYYMLPDDYEFPEAVEKITGVIVNYGMVILMPRSEADIVPAEATLDPVVCDNIAALAALTEEQAQNVKLNLTDAKVTFMVESTGSCYVEDATAAMELVVMDADMNAVAVDGLAQGKAITASLTGMYCEGSFMCLNTDMAITASVDADVTTGTVMTLAEALAPANNYRLVTLVASDELPIVNENGEGYFVGTEDGDHLLAMDMYYSFPADYAYPDNVKQITGILNFKYMPLLVLRSPADIVEAEVDGIETIHAIDAQAAYYSLQGVRLTAPVKGQVCIRVANGKAVKVIVK